MKRFTLLALPLLTLAIVPHDLPAQVLLGVLGGGARGAPLIKNQAGGKVLVDAQAGYQFGAVAAFGIPAGFTLEVTPKYIQKGFRTGVSDLNGGLDLAYVEAPIYAAWHHGLGGPAALRILAGGSLAYEVSCTTEIATGGGTPERQSCADGTTNKFDAGLFAGLGMAVSVLTIDFTYDFGLVNINKDSAGPSVKNRVWGITVAARFAVGG